jgi:NAD-dependent SIR2 family protein deacetylase
MFSIQKISQTVNQTQSIMSQSYNAQLTTKIWKGICGDPEYFDTLEETQGAASDIASLIRNSSRFVVYTGAGISTACGVPDFRGPQGVWTCEEAGLPAPHSVPFDQTTPSYTHLALVELLERKMLDYIVSQNVDGLHVKSGIPPQCIAELHGNVFLEECSVCKHRYYRHCETGSVGLKPTGRYCTQPDCSPAVSMETHVISVSVYGSAQTDSHSQTRSTDTDTSSGTCTTSAVPSPSPSPSPPPPPPAPPTISVGLSDTDSKTGAAPLIDCTLDWDDELRDLDEAIERTKKADLCMCLGTSLRIRPAGNMPMRCVRRNGKDREGDLVIVNLQKTHLDRHCTVRSFVKCDELMQLIMKDLNLHEAVLARVKMWNGGGNKRKSVPIRVPYDTQHEEADCIKRRKIVP